MSPIIPRALLWLSVYVLLALVPLGVALVHQPTEARGFWVELGAMLGLLGLGVLAVQMLITGRHRWFAPELGLDNTLQFHREVGIFALLLVLAHPTTLILADPKYLAYLDPREDTLRAISLAMMVASAIILVCSSLWRVTIGLPYEWWRVLHGGLALFIVTGGLGHALMADHYTAGALTKVVLAGVVLIPLGYLVDTRLLRALRMRRRPWRVAGTQAERGDSTTITLEAVGHDGLHFEPGQFIWVTLGETPFSLQQHPFSFASSATEPRRIAFTAKHVGDFTATLPSVEPGTRAWVEGPYGAFIPNPGRVDKIILIAGGVGITPIMSMLRTFDERRVRTPLWLLYANEHWEDVTFREELDELAETLPLQVIHVISKPPKQWSGETGYIDGDLLERRLPEDCSSVEYFICGPDPLMDTVEKALIRQGVSPTRLFSDRFDLF